MYDRQKKKAKKEVNGEMANVQEVMLCQRKFACSLIIWLSRERIGLMKRLRKIKEDMIAFWRKLPSKLACLVRHVLTETEKPRPCFPCAFA